MGISSSIGLASGLDIDAIVSATMGVERIPIIDLQKKEATFQTKISTFGNLKSSMSALQTSIEKLTETDSFKTSFSATSGDKDVLTVSTDEDASAGNYDINVVQLASSAQINSAVYTAPDQVVGTGTIQLQLGDGGVVDIAIDDEDDHNTLEGIANLINDSNSAVTASVIKKDTDQYILSLKGSKTGRDINYTYQEEGFQFTTKSQSTEDDGSVMVSEGFDSDTNALGLDGTFSIAGQPSIVVTAGDSLTDIQSQINVLSGISAAIVTDSSTGKFTLEVSSDTAEESVTVGFENNLIDTEFSALETTTTAAEKAELEVNGITIYREDNSIDDISEGLTIDLKKDSAGEKVKVAVTGNYNDTAGKISSFVSSYNEVVKSITSLQHYDKDKETGGILMGDPTANAIRSGLRNLVLGSVEGVDDSVNNLSKLGITLERDGTLTFEKDDFNEAMEDSDLRDDVINFFTGTTPGSEGIAVKFESFLDGYTDKREGILTAKEDSFKNSIDRINSDIEAKNRRLAIRENNLRKQYQNLEQLMSTFNATANYLTNQLSSLDSLSKSFLK